MLVAGITAISGGHAPAGVLFENREGNVRGMKSSSQDSGSSGREVDHVHS